MQNQWENLGRFFSECPIIVPPNINCPWLAGSIQKPVVDTYYQQELFRFSFDGEIVPINLTAPVEEANSSKDEIKYAVCFKRKNEYPEEIGRKGLSWANRRGQIGFGINYNRRSQNLNDFYLPSKGNFPRGLSIRSRFAFALKTWPKNAIYLEDRFEEAGAKIKEWVKNKRNA